MRVGGRDHDLGGRNPRHLLHARAHRVHKRSVNFAEIAQRKGDALASLLQDQRPRVEVIVDAACTFLSRAKTSKRDSNRRRDRRLCPACMHRGLLEQIFVLMSDLGDGTLNVGQIYTRSQQDILRQPDALIRQTRSVT